MAGCHGFRHVERSAVVVFAPDGKSLAAGTIAGTIDPNFSTQSTLEVFGLGDFSAPGDRLPLLGSAPAPERFDSIARGPRLPNTPLSHGPIAGGLADGSVYLWEHQQHFVYQLFLLLRSGAG
ncbi:hypothetical protein FOA52_009221 [Chlamydomonas sp. UWO 241]|nr:hypothetical protein FOA52_009221 [Chlamydomonas sp. UWO 241]